MDDKFDILPNTVKRCIFIRGELILAAVSGGPDSVAMLHALHTHSSELGISLHVAHINHGIRGEQSNLDEEFVRKLAQTLRLPVTVGHADVPAMCAELHVGVEEAARIARHTFLRKTAESICANKIAIAHTADDRAETILLNILRGCGIDGLGAMQPIDGLIVRPLIETYRSEIEAYISKHALSYRIDETNLDTTFARNRVRHELIPSLEREFNPAVKSALNRLAEIAASQRNLMQSISESALHEITCRDGIDGSLFANLPEAIQFQIVRSEIEKQKGDLADVTFEQIRSIVESVTQGNEFTFTLPTGRIYASYKGGILRFFCRNEPDQVRSFERALNIPGKTCVSEIELTLNCAIVDNPKVPKLSIDDAMIDASSVVGTLRVRNMKPGDRIVPLGMTGEKKLQDVFVDKKIPRQKRAKVAVVADDEKILWVVGIVSSDTGKITEATKKAICLTSTHDQ